MAHAAHPISGACLCGSVRFSAVLPKQEIAACHCSMCRRWTAGPFLTVEVEGFKAEDESPLGTYRSSKWAERGFCSKCGTSLFYRLVDHDWYAVSVEVLDDKNGLVFCQQIFIDEKPSYYDFANKTKNMTGAEVFESFAAAQEQASERPNG